MPPVRNLILISLLFAGFTTFAQGPTYVKDIKPLIDRHCGSCHRPDDVGAMPLTTYEEVSAYGKMIEYVTSTRLMPPWYADPAYRHFANERVMTEDEIQLISKWVETGMSEGSPTEKTIGQKLTSTPAPVRKPDMVISMSEAFEQYGIYLDQYQVFVLPTQLEKDTWIDGVEFVPGNKKIVRYAGISVENSSAFDASDQWDPRYGYYSFGGLGRTPDQPYWYTWSPQQRATFYPGGSALFLPADSRLIVHIHYGPTGKPQKDSSQVRLYFSANPAPRSVVTAPLIHPHGITGDSLFIAANEKKIFHSAFELPYDIELMSITPQANLLCRGWEVFAKIPGERESVRLLKINDWNFNWKQTYHLDDPIVLPKGTVIHALGKYDNTLDNPCNPAEVPVPFSWGAHLFSEMYFVHFQYTRQAAPSSFLHVFSSPVVADDKLYVSLDVHTPGIYHCTIAVLDKDKSYVEQKFQLAEGHQQLIFSLGDLKNGNYIFQIRHPDAGIVAENLFIKMWEKGM